MENPSKEAERSELDEANAVADGQVPAWLNKEFFQRNLWPESHEPGKTIRSCDIAPATASGDNYASILYRVKLQMENGKTHSVIAKCLPTNPMRQMMLEKFGAYKKEIFIYQELLPVYTRLYKERLGGKGSPPWTKCLYAKKDGMRDIIVMEDLQPEGYVMGDRMNGLTKQQLCVALSSLGLFHALSLAFKVEHLEYFQTKVRKEFDMPTSVLEMLGPILGGCINGIEKLVRGWGFSSQADKLAVMKESSVEDYVALVKDFDEDTAVLNHGDFWINNLLFKEVPEEGAYEVKILDFQLSRYTSPVLDLIYLMVSSTNGEVRKQYWNKLLKESYLSTVHDTLEKLGHGDILRDGIYSIQWLTEELNKKKLFAFYTAITITGMALADSADIPDMNTLKEDNLTEENPIFSRTMKGKTFQKRFREMFDEFMEQGIL